MGDVSISFGFKQQQKKDKPMNLIDSTEDLKKLSMNWIMCR
jgi:hypothetical protein